MVRIPLRNLFHPVLIGAVALAWAGVKVASPSRAEKTEARWWKGNLHTHSLWSDGDNYPDMIADWYRQHDYQFLAISDHNVLQEGGRWIDALKARGGLLSLAKYRQRFGTGWVESKEENGTTMVRLKPLDEYRTQLEKRNEFLMIASEEITDKFEAKPIHLCATNIKELVKPQGGNSVTEVIQRNVDAVLEQRRRVGQAMFPHVNHPNFGFGITAEELMAVKGDRFFEVYNGHPAVYNEGTAERPGTERIWDIILTQHAAEGREKLLYGMATDDSHNYHQINPKVSNPGRGWVMVRSASLSPAGIVNAMEAGDFYASTGVRLRELERSPKQIRLEIEPEAGVTYRTRFIGTRKGYDPKSEPVTVADKDGKPVVVTRKYSQDIGQVLAEVEGLSPAYRLRGDELYVRAVVTSSKPQPNPIRPEDMERAWVQPVRPGR